ncbi:MAG: bifunctional riboflavin kinase/FAD synthetase [bacterium]
MTTWRLKYPLQPMNILNLREFKSHKSSAVALGFFDGVHLGHQAVIGKAVQIARDYGFSSLAFTMKNHPMSLLKKSPPALINTFEERLELLCSTGVDQVVWTDFDGAFAGLTPREFAEEILSGKLRTVAVAAGLDYRFGAAAAGDIRMLAALGLDLSFKVFAVEPIFFGKHRISSTSIRKLIAAGEVKTALSLMGRPFSIRGPVIKGDGRGRTLGFPTANLAFPDEKVSPSEGVYAAWAALRSSRFPAAVSIGSHPTFRGTSSTLEAHLLDFTGDIYGEELALFFMEKIRSQKKFKDPEELSLQIGRDVLSARKILASQPEQECIPLL